MCAYDPALTGIDIAACLVAAGRQNAEGTVKITEDLDRYRTVIAESRPDVIVECGTYLGGSARWFATLDVDVITVDIRLRIPKSPRIIAVQGNSVDPLTIETVRGNIAGRGYRRVMVVLDSDHSAAHVAAEIAAYGPMVTSGCYLVVEDGLVRWMRNQPYAGSPLDAIEQSLMTAGSDADGRPLWVRDFEVEEMSPVTQHPAGWWLRW